MGKKQLHFPEAERLFVVEGALQDIESTIGVSSRNAPGLESRGGWEQKELQCGKCPTTPEVPLHQLPTKILLRIHKKNRRRHRAQSYGDSIRKRVHAKPFKKLRLLKRPQPKLHL